MRIIANYHTHTVLCGHADGMSEDYILEAIKSGFEALGMSDHGPIPKHFMSEQDYIDNYLSRQMDEEGFAKIYLPDLEASIKKYSRKIKIFIGVEIEYLPGHDEYYRELASKLDYMSLGVHYFKSENGIYNTYNLMNESLVMEYAKATEEALDSGFFTILTHPELFMFTYRNKEGKNSFDEAVTMASRIIIEAAIRNNVYLEINGGGPRRGKHLVDGQLEWTYPRSEFWHLVEEYPEALVIIGCDTHTPKELYDATIHEVERFVDQFKFKVQEKVLMRKESITIEKTSK